MRIVIDMQGMQAGSRNRGIGRYTLSIVRAILMNSGGNEIFLAINGAFPESVIFIRNAFKEFVSQKQICVWYPTGPASYVSKPWDRNASELLREAFITNLEPDVILITSIFEGFIDDAVLSVNRLGRIIPTAVILYDLIPYIYPKIYLGNANLKNWYEEKIKHLKAADLHMAISISSQQESINYLGTDPNNVVNISAAADAQFCPLTIPRDSELKLRARYRLSKPYIMYTGGMDHRKNIDCLIKAYAQLPAHLRQMYQLAIVCSINQDQQSRLVAFAKKLGLEPGELILTGFVSDKDLVDLYNMCTLFVFPSWHEGFGLPVLEAMACGKAVITSNCSSLPEVMGLSDALFNPNDANSITQKLEQVLTNTAIREALEQHGIKQASKFSWDRCAIAAISALKVIVEKNNKKNKLLTTINTIHKRPRLAFVSPLPPERSGIAYYSMELLPELARFYEIELIFAQESITSTLLDPSVYVQRNIKWFCENVGYYDRVLYHFGNSECHQHMFSLLEKIPGIVVLHDFFLSGIIAHMEAQTIGSYGWIEALYKSHGYYAVHHRLSEKNIADVIMKYPCNIDILKNAQGVIVHSQTSFNLAKYWYHDEVCSRWQYIPLLRKTAQTTDGLMNAARVTLNLDVDDFVICSFGLIDQTKLNHRLLDAWLTSPLASNRRCILIFVGENQKGIYGEKLQNTINMSPYKERIRITGWVSPELFELYLHAADVGVQLRTLSRGETSAAVLDCMNYGLATIVNAHGSMADLPDTAVWKLPDEFSDAELIEAITMLYRDRNLRNQLGVQAQRIIHNDHHPSNCGISYFNAIEGFYHQSTIPLDLLIKKITSFEGSPNKSQLINTANAIDSSIKEEIFQSQILIDVTKWFISSKNMENTERVAQIILKKWLFNPSRKYRIEPIYFDKDSNCYRYARKFTLNFMGCPTNELQDEPISYNASDFFINLDAKPHFKPEQLDIYQTLRCAGVVVKFLVYDLLPITSPQFFTKKEEESHQKWLTVATEFDEAICISQSVAKELSDLLKNSKPNFSLKWFHLGTDSKDSFRSRGIPKNSEKLLHKLKKKITFMMVGTLEPSKGHGQVLDAFEILWQAEHDVNLLIVGEKGLMSDGFVQRLNKHSEKNIHLFWLEHTSEEFLRQLYSICSCLIAASYGEGFCLPVIEAARHKLPVIARDIPVFRELAKDCAYYFETISPKELAKSIEDWMTAYVKEQHPSSEAIPWLTWSQSANNLLNCVVS